MFIDHNISAYKSMHFYKTTGVLPYPLTDMTHFGSYRA